MPRISDCKYRQRQKDVSRGEGVFIWYSCSSPEMRGDLWQSCDHNDGRRKMSNCKHASLDEE